MTTTVRRKPKPKIDPVQTFLQHLTLKHEGKTINSRAEALKKRLKEWLPTTKDAYENENGSLFYDLPETVEVGGKRYRGMELRRSVSHTFNEETAERIVRARGVYEEATEPVLSQDKIYRLVQEGKITEPELEEMFEEKESFAFWANEGEVID